MPAMPAMPAQDVFYDKMISDPRVSHFFNGVDMKQLRNHQVHLQCLTVLSSLSDTVGCQLAAALSSRELQA
jgi:truncated hemoglobin YjbI